MRDFCQAIIAWLRGKKVYLLGMAFILHGLTMRFWDDGYMQASSLFGQSDILMGLALIFLRNPIARIIEMLKDIRERLDR